jgi:hypothetical protein
MMIAEAVVYLGPAKVVTDSGRPGYVQVTMPDNELVWARVALVVPYRVAAGDEVLVICHGRPHTYVIGLLETSGPTTLRVPGDLRLEAPDGVVQIAASRGIRLHSDQSLDLEAARATFRFLRLNMLVTTLVQRLENAYTWATGLVQSKSRRVRSIAEEGWLMSAGRAHIKTTDNVHIGGKTIHLG